MNIFISKENARLGSKDRFGLFFEDLNYALDGGLYAEMIENCNFEAKDAHGPWDHYIVDNDGGYAWNAYPKGADVKLKIKTDRALFAENPHFMRIESTKEGQGIANKAYDGIYLEKGKSYKVNFYARAYHYKGKVEVGVFFNGVPVATKKVRIKCNGEWRKYSFTIRSKQTVEKADFAFILINKGTVHLDRISMIPTDAVLGLFRPDLVEWMKEVKPSFLRFPGGCVVEGNNLPNRYLWKNSIGMPERRKHNWNRWAVHGTDENNGFRSPYSHYGQTLGIGYYEYFLLCEYLGAKPLPVVSVGIACQYMSTQFVPYDDKELDDYIQEALDIVEFANGDVNTVWGKVRADMGHPQPFRLEMLGVGNEQWETEDNHFYDRFEIFEKRIHEVYPDLKIIGTAGPTVATPSHESAWKWIKANLEKNPDFVYATDEHFYVPPAWLYENVNTYDSYPRNCKVYAGEYAAHVPGSGCAFFNSPSANVFEGALAEAAFMTGMERNSDVVIMASYAPLFGRLGYTQWSPDMIWFDGKSSYASVNYYVQKLYSLYSGNTILETKGEEKDVYFSATEENGITYVKVVNASTEKKPVTVEGDFAFGELARIILLKADLKDYNTIEEPDKVCPVEVAPTSPNTYTLPPQSFAVLIFRSVK